MSKPKDPPRLVDASSDTTDAVRAVLRAGRRELPGPSDLARLAARLPLGPLPPPGASPPGASPPPPPPPAPGHLTAAAAGPSVASSALLGALLGLGVVGGVWWRDTATAPRDAAPSAIATASGPSAAAPTPTPPRLAEPGFDGAGHDGAGHAGSEAGRGAARAPSSATAPRDELLPRASTAAPRAGGAAIPSPGAPSGDAPASASPPSAGAAETEVQLLHRAQDALAADAGSSFALTVEHARRFPTGALAQEREIIAIRALLALGRAAEARARAASLLERFPGSAYRGRLESLGLEESSPKD
ncbi:hypothetical protein [Sorangium atrum]|uniref:Uncharacterized protein n=1 Tax=Sorangium atrum TaxID=2995308 RepID=A0ABT5BQ93_9BACT|nr:hypothetical protein [Sorangium aterium]MDC0676257.1 hypothetical protein [Sorangium aterium]